MGVLTPGTGVVNEIQVTGAANALSAGPTTGAYAGTIWFTETSSTQIGEINVSSQTVLGYATAPDSNANAITLGPDGNEWFTSGQNIPAMMGAVVLNPNDLGTQVVVTSQPPNVEQTIFGGFTWGFGVTVAVENSAGQVDPFVQMGTITIALDSNPGGDTLQGTLTLPIDNGVADFGGLTLTKPAAGYTIQATYSLGLNAPVTNPFYVAGQPTKLVVTTEPPANVPAGSVFGISVSAEDSNGFVVPTFDDPIGLTISTNPPGDGVLNGTIPLGALYGTAAFDDLAIDQSGMGYVLQAEDLTPGTTLTAGQTDKFNVTAGLASQLVFAISGEPVPTAVAGQNFAAASNVVVDAEDKSGSIDTTYNGPVTIELANNATGVLVGTLTVNAVNGVATFTNLAIDTAGTFMLAATGTGLTAGTSTSITITPAPAAQLAWVTEPPAVATEDLAFGGTLDVEDRYGNLATGYNGNVSVTLDLNGISANGDLAGTTTVAASGGVATFTNIIITTTGDPFTLIAKTSTFTPVTSSPIDVVAPALVVTNEPLIPVDAGAGFSLTWAADTPQDTLDTAFDGIVTLTINTGPAGAALNGSTTATAVNGIANFGNVILDTPGSYVLKASSPGVTPGFTATITVIIAAAGGTTAPTNLSGLSSVSTNGNANSPAVVIDPYDPQKLFAVWGVDLSSVSPVPHTTAIVRGGLLEQWRCGWHSLGEEVANPQLDVATINASPATDYTQVTDPSFGFDAQGNVYVLTLQTSGASRWRALPDRVQFLWLCPEPGIAPEQRHYLPVGDRFRRGDRARLWPWMRRTPTGTTIPDPSCEQCLHRLGQHRYRTSQSQSVCRAGLQSEPGRAGRRDTHYYADRERRNAGFQRRDRPSM